MRTTLSPHFVLPEVTQNDLIIASICWGFTLGFGFLTTWKAIRQTTAIYQRYGVRKLNTPYVWMIWLEIIVCFVFSVICWLYLRRIILPSIAFYLSIVTCWALQVQFLLQIIVSRINLLLTDRKKARNLKIGVAVLITAVNISVYCIWVPSRLQISQRYIHINDIWDRCEKVIYLLVDASLNYLFIRVVQRDLVKSGLQKYQALVRFNMYIIGFSLAMDVLIISTMSLNNSFVYMQFHPLAYIVKLNIEMTMSNLISKIARAQNGCTTSATDSVVARNKPCHSRNSRRNDLTLTLSNTTVSTRPRTDGAESPDPPDYQWEETEYDGSYMVEMDEMSDVRQSGILKKQEFALTVEHEPAWKKSDVETGLHRDS